MALRGLAYNVRIADYNEDVGIDINAESAKAIIQSMVATNVLTQDEADAVIALAD